MKKLKLPQISLQKIIRPMVGLGLLAAFTYTGYLARQIHLVEADEGHLKAGQAKLQQQKLRFDRETLEEITAPTPAVGSGRNPFAP